MSAVGYHFIGALPSFYSKFVVGRLLARSIYVFGRAGTAQEILESAHAVDYQ